MEQDQFEKKLKDTELFLLDLFLPKPTTDFDSIDALIREGESNGIHRKLVEDATLVMENNPANYVHFFDTLTSPEWIEPLSECDFFKRPPEAIQEADPKQDRVMFSFPPWPESRYLARVAEIAPDSVLKVMLQLGRTDNAHVHWDLVKAACAMPASHAAEWAEREAEWVAQQNYLYMLLPDRLGRLVAHLANGGETQSALNIARPLLTVRPHLGREDEDSDDWLGARTRPRPKFEGYEYKHVLETCMSPLLTAAGVEVLTLLCCLLDKVLDDSAPIRQRQQEEFAGAFGLESTPSIHDSFERSEPRKDHLDYMIELIGDDNNFISDAEDWLVASVRVCRRPIR